MGVAVVTGASSGLGKAFAEELSRKTGAVSEVWAIARDEKRLQALKASCPPGRLRIFPMDLTEKGVAEEIAGILNAEKKRISVLVNCAGFGKTGKVQELKAEEQSEICRLNAEALTSVTWKSPRQPRFFLSRALRFTPPARLMCCHFPEPWPRSFGGEELL